MVINVICPYPNQAHFLTLTNHNWLACNSEKSFQNHLWFTLFQEGTSMAPHHKAHVETAYIIEISLEILSTHLTAILQSVKNRQRQFCAYICA